MPPFCQRGDHFRSGEVCGYGCTKGREKKPDIAAIRLNRFLFDYAIVDIVYQRYGEDQGQLLESSRHGYKLRSKIMKEQA